MSEGNVNDRLEQSSMGGTPKVNPDEQRKYLGTFRERVSFAIKIKDLKNPDAIKDLNKEFNNNNSYQLILNGNLEHDMISPFIKLASKNNIKFVVKTDSFYKTEPENYGVVYANKQSINVNKIDFENKYNHEKVENKNLEKKESFLDKVKNIFK
ncbi:YueI family protein [Apilactobacillus apisilvae]|uniref:YueI family protein n=1 Tax=Apilactobacillus apisilvae TaxID=2923364 RepID=A0ABY4PHL6_9LACO|nr:YueI family protein [Apilactobacillus apisilvae]UQS85165.1 YueI family protein [Apilactobacillus apisilvae]